MNARRIDHRLAAATLGRLLELVEGGAIGATRGQVERLEGARLALEAQPQRRSRRQTPQTGDTRSGRNV